jgi:hypothetical protein
MGATNITADGTLDLFPHLQTFGSAAIIRVKNFDGAKNSGLWTAATHPVISIPIGYALKCAWYYVTTTFAGGTSAQFKISDSAALTAAITVATNGLDKGTGGFIGHLPDDDVVGWADVFAHTAAQTLDCVIAGTMTAGAMVIGAELIHVAALTAQQ